MSQTTKRALEASLKQLLLKKPLNKITINDITENCGVNRMTFYYHFKDIYDLVEWVFEEDAARLLDGKLNAENWKEGFLCILWELRDNKPLVMNVYRSISREQLERYLYKLVYKLLRRVLDTEAEKIPVREEDKELIVNFYKYALVGMALDWVGRDMKEEPEIIAEKLDCLIRGSAARAIEAFRRDRL